MENTHIRLTRSGREEGAALVVPVAGTTFEITTDLETLVTTATGRVYVVEESLNDIEETLNVAFVGASGTSSGGLLVELTSEQAAMVRALLYYEAIKHTDDQKQQDALYALADLFETVGGKD